MSRWFRHYAGMMRDDKLVRAAIQSGQTVERTLWVWGAILESAAEVNDGGRFDIDTAEIAYFLRSDETDIRAIIEALTGLNRVAENRVVNWGTRQFESDRSASRQAAYRERKRQGAASDAEQPSHPEVPPSRDGEVTSLSRHGDTPETETETETETEKNKSAGADAPRAPAKEAKSKRKPETPIPDDHRTSEANRKRAYELGFSDAETEREAEKFRAHAKSKDRRCRDWDAAERQWFVAAAGYANKQPRKATGPPADAPIDWGPILDAFKRFGRWPSSGYGGQPGMTSCMVPLEILQMHGLGSA